MKTSQERGGYADYWRIGEFQTWVSDNEETRLLYDLAFEVNGAVMTAAQGWRVLRGWAGLFGLAMIDTTPDPKPFELPTVGTILELWRQRLCAFFADVVSLERAVDLICEGYFDGHDALFKDSREELTSSHEAAKLLIVGYNCVALENGREVIDIDCSHHFREGKVTRYLNEWVMLSQSSGLVARGKVFEARDKVLALLKDEDSVPQRQLS